MSRSSFRQCFRQIVNALPRGWSRRRRAAGHARHHRETPQVNQLEDRTSGAIARRSTACAQDGVEPPECLFLSPAL